MKKKIMITSCSRRCVYFDKGGCYHPNCSNDALKYPYGYRYIEILENEFPEWCPLEDDSSLESLGYSFETGI